MFEPIQWWRRTSPAVLRIDRLRLWFLCQYPGASHLLRRARSSGFGIPFNCDTGRFRRHKKLLVGVIWLHSRREDSRPRQSRSVGSGKRSIFFENGPLVVAWNCFVANCNNCSFNSTGLYDALSRDWPILGHQLIRPWCQRGFCMPYLHTTYWFLGKTCRSLLLIKMWPSIMPVMLSAEVCAAQLSLFISPSRTQLSSPCLHSTSSLPIGLDL